MKNPKRKSERAKPKFIDVVGPSYGQVEKVRINEKNSVEDTGFGGYATATDGKAQIEADPIERLFAGIRFRRPEEKVTSIARVRGYVAARVADQINRSEQEIKAIYQRHEQNVDAHRDHIRQLERTIRLLARQRGEALVELAEQVSTKPLTFGSGIRDYDECNLKAQEVARG